MRPRRTGGRGCERRAELASAQRRKPRFLRAPSIIRMTCDVWVARLGLPGSMIEENAMDVRAAVAYAPGKPLEVTTVQLEGPRGGEVLVEIKATGICHTDEFTRSGADPEGLFPAILGHEGAGIVVDVGAGVTSVKKGDHVIPLYTPECRQCPSCLSRKTNLCTAIRATQGQGV